ncbi:MAG: hypothetical protein JWO24_4180 [Rhodospirillales bacterium]|nr:hypothetical protein [Rhodospirillales bacterium]
MGAQCCEHRPSHAGGEHLHPFISMVHVLCFHGRCEFLSVYAKRLSKALRKIGEDERLAIPKKAACFNDPCLMVFDLRALDWE